MIKMFLKFNQPELWLLTANVKETTVGCQVYDIGNAQSMQIPSVRVFGDFYGKYQSDDEAKPNMCSVFNDISHFQCFVTMHKF